MGFRQPETMFRPLSNHQKQSAGRAPTAKVLPGEPYQVAMTDDFHPWRRDVRFAADVRPAPIRPLLPQLTFITDPQRWGYVFRFGLLSVPAADFVRITRAMQA